MTGYGYDVQDHLTSVIDGEGSTTSYAYSDRDLMTSEVSPVSGTTGRAYSDHGELVATTDARGITVFRSLDAADRVTLVDYPDDDLDTAYTYDDVAVAFSKGRLTRIIRDTTVTDYAYDRFGRMLQDGSLSHTYDANGNLLTVVYPGPVTATYTYDFADRPVTLSAQRPGFSNRTLVTGATYSSFGPLATLTLANTLTETRTFDFRYQPTGIALAGATPRLDWDYTTDKEGNVLSITDALNPASSRTFAYQDFAYFLTCAAGPWAPAGAGCSTVPFTGQPLRWSYDRIGNRLTETRVGVTDNYAYKANGGGGNTARLSQVTLGVGGTRTYQYTPAGHVEQVASGGNVIDFSNDDTGQLAMLNRAIAETSTDLAYDGRGFLRFATETIPNPDAGAKSSLAPARGQSLLRPRGTPGTPIFADGFEGGDVCEWTSFVGIPDPGCPPDFLTSNVTATYSSEGVLQALERDAAPTARHVFYFGSRPVALRDLTGTTETWRWVTTDPNGLTTCVLVSGNILAELGGLFYAAGDHSALLIDGPCTPSGSCSSPGPILYDPAGGYSAQFPGAGSAETLTREVPGWSRQGFFDYHCDSGSDLVEVYCFETTCCEERQIEAQIPGGKRPGYCAVGVGEAVRGIGPFAPLGSSGTPAILRRAMNRLLRRHSGAGAFTWTHTCSGSADR